MLKQPVALLVACGKLGQRVGMDLQQAGYRVLAVRRSPPQVATPISPQMTAQTATFEWVAADITQSSAIQSLPQEIELLVYTPTPSRQYSDPLKVGVVDDGYRLMYAEVTSQLVRHFQTSMSLKRALLISSTRVYEERGGAWVDEDTPVYAESSATQAVIDGENHWLNGFEGKACVLRLAGIYGPGREWQIRRLLSQQPIQYDPPSYTNRIHEQDAARLMSFLLLQSTLQHKVYVGVDDDPIDEGALFTWLANQLQVAAPPALSAFDGAVKQNKRCHNTRIKSLGFPFTYPSFREGYADMLASAKYLSPGNSGLHNR